MKGAKRFAIATVLALILTALFAFSTKSYAEDPETVYMQCTSHIIGAYFAMGARYDVVKNHNGNTRYCKENCAIIFRSYANGMIMNLTLNTY